MTAMIKQMIRSMVVGFLVPAALVLAVLAAAEKPPETELPTKPIGQKVTLPPAATVPTTVPTEAEMPLFLPVLHGGQTENWDIEVYLVGVLLAEVPASFEAEALKAQAVAARTYALKCHQMGYKHGGAVCTDGTCCQGYITPQDYLQRGGSEEGVNKIRSAVEATRGEVLVYGGTLIVATYFSCSGGRTEDAQAVWGQDYPYLQAVESPGEEQASYFADEKHITPEQLQAALAVTLPPEPETWLGEMTYTDGEGVDSLCIGGVQYRGTTLRSLLGLRSTRFTVNYRDGVFVFATLGYGHRVGLSQYGAEAMALAGSDYQQILIHYYQGTEITLFSAKNL